MNSGMPNASELLAKSLLVASGVTGISGWILQKALVFLLKRGSERLLILGDELHMGIVVSREKNSFNKANDEAWEIVDQGKILTKEEINAIDQKVLDAFLKLSTFSKLRK